MSIEMLIFTTFLAGAVLVVAVGAAFFLKRQLHICEPNEVLIFSGRKRQLSDGSRVGYRVIRGGRGFRIPIIEKVDRLLGGR